jgi:hypothetical protein
MSESEGLLSVVWFGADLKTLPEIVRRNPRMRTLQIHQAQLQALPALLVELPSLRALDISGAPIPNEVVEQVRRSRPELEICTSPINLGWEPGIPGVLRVPDGFALDDVPMTENWITGVEVSVRDRQLLLTERYQPSQIDFPDYEERVYGPTPVEDFVRQGPPTKLNWLQRESIRRVLEARIPAP